LLLTLVLADPPRVVFYRNPKEEKAWGSSSKPVLASNFFQDLSAAAQQSKAQTTATGKK
jgi:hypothetical protein